MRTDYNLKEITLQAFEEFILLEDKDTTAKPDSNQWSPQEILGHLLDSATINHGRFVRAQFSNDLVVEKYAQDDWVRVQDYQGQNWQDLLITWRQLNLLISNLMFNTAPEVRDQERKEHNLHETAMHSFDSEKPVTLGDFMSDYVEHLKHHLGQIRTLVEKE